MQFANPVALWLLALVALPLLLTRRRRPVRHTVSALFLWRAAAHPSGESLARRRRRRGWHMAIQMACIAATVAALSAPVVTLRRGTTALVFDLSASMAVHESGGETRMSAATSRAHDVLRRLRPSSRVRVIAAGAFPREVGEWPAADPRLGAALSALTPTAGAADLAAALDAASRPPGTDAVVVFSDAAPGNDLASSTTTPPLTWVRVGRGQENAAVTRVAVRPFTHGGDAGQVLVTVRNYGSEPRNADVQLAVDGRAVHRTTVRLAAGRDYSLQVPLPNLGRIVTASVTGSDALPLDNLRSALVPRSNAVRVALAGPPGSFLHRVLDVNPAVALERYDPNTRTADLDGAWASGRVDVVVCDRCAMPAREAPLLVALPASTRAFRGPVLLSSAMHPVGRAIEPSDDYATASDGPPLPPGAEVVLRVGGIPAAVAIERDGRRQVDMRFDLSRHDFALTPAFPILIANAIEWLSGQGDVPQEAIAGEPLTIARRGAPAAAVRVIGPDGRPRSLRHLADRSILADTDDAGAYRIVLADVEHVALVNPAVDSESDLSRTQTVALDLVDGNLGPARGGVSAAPWLALMALALMAVDWRFRMARTS